MATKKGRAQRDWIAFGVIAVIALGSAAYQAVAVGAVSASALLIAMTTASLGLSLYWIYRSIATLFDDSPTSDEVAKVEGRIRRELLREKRMLLKALAELELDYDMGKLSERDYREASVNYRARLAKLFRQLDAGADYDAFVAEELKRRRRTTPAPKEAGEAAPGATAVAATASKSESDSADSATESGSDSASASDSASDSATDSATESGSDSDSATDSDSASASAPVAPKPSDKKKGKGKKSAPAKKVCAKCGTQNDPDAAFCKKCGTAVS